MAGVFNLRPALLRYTFTWDVNVVLQYLKNLGPSDKLLLKKTYYEASYAYCIDFRTKMSNFVAT